MSTGRKKDTRNRCRALIPTVLRESIDKAISDDNGDERSRHAVIALVWVTFQRRTFPVYPYSVHHHLRNSISRSKLPGAIE